MRHEATLVQLTPPAPLRGMVDEPIDAYHLRPALGRSVLDRIIRSPQSLQHYLHHGDKDSPAKKEGRALHELCRDPDAFWSGVAYWTGGDKVKNAGAWKKFKADNAGKEILDDDDRALYVAIDVAFDVRVRRPELEGALVEQSLYFERRGVACKARPDVMKGRTLYDLKFVHDMESFPRDAWKYGYHRQAAWYLDAATAATGELFTDFVFIVIEKKLPVEIDLWEAPADFIAAGRAENDLNFAQYQTCLERHGDPRDPKNVWPGRGTTRRILPPSWRSQ